MKILLLENGSEALLWQRDLLRGNVIVEQGYPFVPDALAEIAAGCDRVVFSAAAIPPGIDLPYYQEELQALCRLPVPVLGLGRAGGILLEAHGAKVKMANQVMTVRTPPPAWTEQEGVWKDGKGNCAVLSFERQVQEKAVRDWLGAENV